MRTALMIVSGFAALFVFAYALSTSPAPTPVRPGLTLMTLEQEAELGTRRAREILQSNPAVTDPAIRSRFEGVVTRLARHLGTSSNDWSYSVEVIEDDRSVVQALPGGFLLVSSGTLEVFPTDDELAALLAHAIGHVELRHGAQQLTATRLIAGGLELAGGGRLGFDVLGNPPEDPGSRLAARLAGAEEVIDLWTRFNPRAEEEADVFAIQTMAAAGYDPETLSRVTERLAALSAGTSTRVADHVAAHPAYAGRAERQHREVLAVGLVGRLSPGDDRDRGRPAADHGKGAPADPD